ncbi:hypothetical protein [Thermodesulforhabdus norvegica]|uniref:Acetoin utilization deacetylase AcuC n=1 Tax=Thermodesulforhabdus norvegica TaxID=39841 RepID=A0A1I4SF81_9BACT|nr:hypothetical protein [Thermodesulforhabdus norvegica]SFM63034.1 Acetoin utilization deacetylase AcuC [Thermodesulforhabdus norvegica]
MPRIAVTYHESFSRRSYLTRGTRLSDFPEVLKDLVSEGRVEIVNVGAVPDEIIRLVHTDDHIYRVKQDPLCSTAWHSVGSVLTATELVVTGRFRRAFALIGAGGHHAGRNYFWGYCCFNDVVITIEYIRNRYGLKRFAIIDTDAHHGDGTRELVQNDPDVLHCCVCSMNYRSGDNSKIDISAFDVLASCRSFQERDEAYAEAIRSRFIPAVESFAPEVLFWYFGFDTHRGDYGDLGLTSEAYVKIAESVTVTAERLCDGKLVVVLGGGSRRDLASHVIPRVIRTIAELEPA